MFIKLAPSFSDTSKLKNWKNDVDFNHSKELFFEISSFSNLFSLMKFNLYDFIQLVNKTQLSKRAYKFMHDTLPFIFVMAL